VGRLTVSEAEWRELLQEELTRANLPNTGVLPEEATERLLVYLRELCFAASRSPPPKATEQQRRRRVRAAEFRRAAQLVRREINASPLRTTEAMRKVIGLATEIDKRGRPVLGANQEARKRLIQVAAFFERLAKDAERGDDELFLIGLRRKLHKATGPYSRRSRFVARAMLLWEEIAGEEPAHCRLSSGDRPSTFLSLVITATTPIAGCAKSPPHFAIGAS
jgi:hypothetical protein